MAKDSHALPSIGVDVTDHKLDMYIAANHRQVLKN